MQCPRCRFKETRYDSLTSMWFCPKCNNMWEGDPPEATIDDVDPEIDTELVKEVMAEEESEFEDEDEDEFYYDEDYTYDISFAASLFIAICLIIPVINIIVYFILLQSDYKDNIKNVYAGLFVSNILAVGLSTIGLVYVYSNNYIPAFRDKCVDIVADVTMESFKDYHIFKNPDFSLPVNYNKLAHNTTVETFIVDSVSNTDVELTYIDGSYLTGITVRTIMDDYTDNKVCYLIRTNAMVKKNGTDQWVNYGTVVDVAEKSDADTYFVNQSKIAQSYNYYTDEYNNPKFVEWDVITDKRYIFQVKDSSVFLCNLLYNEEDEFIGFAFTEQE